VAQRLELIQDLTGSGEQYSAGICKFDAAFVSLIQFGAKVTLERLETLGDGGRTDMHPSSRLGEAVVLGDVYKELDAIK